MAEKIPPEQISRVVALREAGYTLQSIAEKTGLSVSSIKRISKDQAAKPGKLTSSVVDEARKSLIEQICDDAFIRTLAAQHVREELTHAAKARKRMSEACDHLVATDLESAATVMRAIASYMTALRHSQQVLRRSLDREHVLDGEESLPTLTILELTAEQIEEMRAEQRREAEALGMQPSSETADDDVVYETGEAA